MAHKEYTLILTQAPNGGWIIKKCNGPHHIEELMASYSNKSHMLTGLSDLIDEIAELKGEK